MRSDTEDRALVIDKATFFTAVAFRGRGQYERVQAASLQAAREAAKALHTNRPVAIYAVAHCVDGATERAVHVENWEPRIQF